MEHEIELISDQFRSLAEQKEKLDDELRPLNEETKSLRDQISAFQEREQEAKVRLLLEYLSSLLSLCPMVC